MSDERSGYPGAPPGWYPDPAGGPGQRWWDGYAWNEAVILPAQPPPPPWVASSARMVATNTSTMVLRELSITPIARLALAFPAVYFLSWLLFFRVYSSQLRSLGHQMHHVFQAAQNNQTPPTIVVPAFSGAISSLVNVVGIMALAAVVLGCVWQFRAASAARSMGLPASHTPGWGVALWFIPIVNYWMPYQSIRDCLAASDPNRSVVLRYWLFFIGAQATFSTAFVASLFSASVALSASIPAALLSLGVLANAPRVVTAIAAAHRAGAGSTPPATSVSG